MSDPGPAASAAIETVFHEEWGRIVASLIRRTGDWDLAEECAQDAFAEAATRWPREGVPRRPGAWLTTVAGNRALDRLRRRGVEAGKLREVATMPDTDPVIDPATGLDDATADAVASSGIGDDRLRLIFTCCHPALALDARVVLTLRTLCGLTTPRIARAFLLPEATMAQRIVRAKRRIRDAGIPYRVPPAELLPERTGGVLAVIYLLYTGGYIPSDGDRPLRDDLSDEAVRLARTMAALMPDEPETLGLLALLLLQDARRAARVDSAGDLVPLDEQDRSRWDAARIAEGVALVDRALRLPQGPSGTGPYQIQAAIAACHATALDAAATDWVEIAGLYAALERRTPTPIVRLNRAIAIGMADGPNAGLARLAALETEGELAGYHLLPAARADLLRRAGRLPAAAEAYRVALDGAPTEPERRFFQRRLGELGH
ncbi:MAG TPA: DUF6596 domain-containing protein [Thermomicrobiales bacterium]|jgi:RNA polymerase sigma-70 factor (ECF subfamily)|nr:DUF6596 domain-containing protein [Thermomicrobiales bacterium]